MWIRTAGVEKGCEWSSCFGMKLWGTSPGDGSVNLEIEGDNRKSVCLKRVANNSDYLYLKRLRRPRSPLAASLFFCMMTMAGW